LTSKFDLTSLVGYLFAAAVTISCVRHLYRGGLKEDFKVFQNRTWKDWLEVLVGNCAAIAGLVGCYYLSRFGPKFLDWSWISLLSSDKHSQGANQVVIGATIPYFGIVFLLLLMLNLPRLAAAEEDEFRYGTKNWWHAVPRSLTFGLMHMVVGVPLWCGLALSVPGMWFTRQYFKGGVERSTMTHAVYNFMLAGVLLFSVIAATVTR
jgi:hypothetical protein